MFEKLKRWIMNIFKISQEIAPEIGNQKDYFENHILVWKQIYKGYYEEWHKLSKINGGCRTMASMQVAKLICCEMARLTFSEKVVIKINNEEVQNYVDKVMNENNFKINYRELLEYNYALGGAITKGYRKNDTTQIGYTSADNFIPIEYNNKGITGGLFIEETIKGDYVYVLVEKQELSNRTVTIEYKLYKYKKNVEGTRGVLVDLAELYPDLQEQTTITNVDHPMFSYTKPNIGNNIDMDTPLGISLFANSLETIKSLDIAFDSFQREFVLGRKRIVVPAYALKSVTDPTSGNAYNYFDSTIDVYEGLNISEQDKIEDDTQELRVDEHISAINALLNILCLQIGVSQGFISFDAKNGLKTATEVISENSKTFRTKKDHEHALEKNLRETIDIIVSIGRLYEEIEFRGEYEVEISFDDSIIEDKVAERVRDQLEVTMGLMSKVEYRMKWYREDIETAKKWVSDNDNTIIGGSTNEGD